MTRPIRVLVASHTYVVGANQAKLRALAATGRLDVGLLVPRRWRDRELGVRFELEDATEGLVRLFGGRIAFAGRVGGYLFSPADVTHALRTFHPDVLHVEAEVFSLVAMEMVTASRAWGVPVTLFCWENVARRLGPRSSTTRWVTSSLAHLFAGSTPAAELVQGWGYRGPVTVVPQLGIDVPAELRSRAFPPSRPRVGFVGRLAHHKGVDLLLRALAEAQGRGVEAQAIIVGTGPLEPELQKVAAAVGVSDRVSWRGWVAHTEVPKALRDVDLLALPSRSTRTWREQFGHVLIEAMAQGIPVVGSSCGAIPDVIGRPDLVFPEEDHEALAELLVKLLTDRGFYEAASLHSVERVRSFTNEAISEAMVPVWEALGRPGVAEATPGRQRWARR